jgi:hypothetical protein
MSGQDAGQFQNPIGKLPKRAQWAVFLVLFAVAFGGFQLYRHLADEAKTVTPEEYAAMTPIQKSRFQIKAIANATNAFASGTLRGNSFELYALAIRTHADIMQLADEYPSNKALKHCQLAALTLVHGIEQIDERGFWGNPSGYKADFERCK